MKEYERIPVFVKVIQGRTVCICKVGCEKKGNCEPDIVTRHLFRGWRGTMQRDRYGK